MSGFVYSARTLESWPELPRSTVLFDGLQLERRNNVILKARCERLAKMIHNHKCEAEEMNNRPTVTAHHYEWLDNGTALPGIALVRGRRTVAHLTPTECFALANKITDLAEALEAQGEA